MERHCIATLSPKNTLNFHVSKADFNQILAGNKKELFRNITESNYRKYILNEPQGDELMKLRDDADKFAQGIAYISF